VQCIQLNNFRYVSYGGPCVGYVHPCSVHGLPHIIHYRFPTLFAVVTRDGPGFWIFGAKDQDAMLPHVNATARKCLAHDTPSWFLACAMLVHLSGLATLVLCELYRYPRHAVAPSTMIDSNLAGTAGAPYKASRANHGTTMRQFPPAVVDAGQASL
jgi:hypothetical protein